MSERRAGGIGADPVPGDPRHAGAGPRRLGEPRGVAVRPDAAGAPAAVRGAAVEAVREEWVVEDRWWTGRPLRRRYLELVLEDGRNAVVFRDLEGGGWYAQRA